MIGVEIFDGESLSYRPNRTPLPCPDCDRTPDAVFFDYERDEDSALLLDERTFDVCHVKENLAYVHVDVTTRSEIEGAGIKCPACGFEPENRDDVESTGKGVHADQTTLICPECESEEWGQGWSIEWSEKYD